MLCLCNPYLVSLVEASHDITVFDSPVCRLQVFGLMSPNDVDVDDSFVLNEKKRWKVQKLLMLIEKKLNDWPKAAELSCHMLIKQIR